jgi:hypothetical protein
MSTRRTFSLAGSTVFALVSWACHDSTEITGTAPARSPRELLMVSGDGQQGSQGGMLEFPLRVRVISSDGAPLGGTVVRWSVIAGEAIAEPAESSTDPAGEAETHVTLGNTVGRVAVNASIAAIPPLTFSLTTLGPCRGKHTPKVLRDVAVHGALEPQDCTFHGGQLHDFYSFVLTSQEAVVLSVQAAGYDPAVDLFTFIDQRDRGTRSDTVDSRREAKLKAILPAGMYETAASSVVVGDTGPYTLLLATTASPVEACEPVFVVRGINTSQQLTEEDCVDGSGLYYGDIFHLRLEMGERVRLTQTSAELIPQLLLYHPTGELVGHDRGFEDGTATVDFVADATGVYRVVATGMVLESGAYDLRILDPPLATAALRRPLPIQALGTTSGFNWKRDAATALHTNIPLVHWHRP